MQGMFWEIVVAVGVQLGVEVSPEAPEVLNSNLSNNVILRLMV